VIPAPLSPAQVYCTGCGKPLAGGRYNSGAEFRCSNCDAQLLVEVFPALFRGAGAVPGGEALISEGEASCFYHPHKKAVALCSACGSFLCTLCETDLAGSCLCPSCIDKGRLGEGIEQLVTQRTLKDSLALSVAILPMVFFPVTLVSAPIAIFIAIRFWGRPGSILPRTKIRFVSAILIALAQIAGWVALLFYKVL
jgi:LSD1 subclass zinc finger protein